MKTIFPKFEPTISISIFFSYFLTLRKISRKVLRAHASGPGETCETHMRVGGHDVKACSGLSAQSIQNRTIHPDTAISRQST